MEAPEHNAGNRILDSLQLQLSQIGYRDAVENRVAVVEAGPNKGNCDCFGSVVSEGVANVTKSTKVIEGGLTNWWDVRVRSEMTVKGDVESLYSVGKGNQGASNADSSKWRVVNEVFAGC
jgi:hypothetical protein